MALIFHPPSPTAFGTKRTHFIHHSPPLYFPSQVKTRILALKSEEGSSSTSNSSGSQKNPESTTISSSSPVTPPPKNPNSASGLGFGSSANATGTTPLASKKQLKGNKERAKIIRRSPVEKPKFATQKEDIKAKEQSQAESAFLLAWLGLGAIILVEGIALAASGFLPEEWDNFFVKYLYPSFTPTVFFFVTGTVAYGVLKYLQNEQFKSDN